MLSCPSDLQSRENEGLCEVRETFCMFKLRRRLQQYMRKPNGIKDPLQEELQLQGHN